MTTIEAVYQNGVFKPIGEVKLSENQRVRLTIVFIIPSKMACWPEIRAGHG